MLNLFLLFTDKFLLLRFLRPWVIPQLLQKSHNWLKPLSDGAPQLLEYLRSLMKHHGVKLAMRSGLW